MHEINSRACSKRYVITVLYCYPGVWFGHHVSKFVPIIFAFPVVWDESRTHDRDRGVLHPPVRLGDPCDHTLGLDPALVLPTEDLEEPGVTPLTYKPQTND